MILKIKLFIRTICSYSLFAFSFTIWAPVVLLLNKMGLVQKTAFQSSLKLWGRLTTKIMPLNNLTIEGVENIDPDKNYVFLSNHQSIMDITLSLGYIPKNFVFLAKKELTKFPIFGSVMQALQFIPVDRSNPAKAIDSLKEAGKLMSAHNLSVSLFAEGTRTRTGKVGKFKNGGFVLAQEAEVDIIPVSIKGNFEIAPKDALLFQKYGDLKLTIHPPISVVGRDIKELKKEVEDIIKKDVE